VTDLDLLGDPITPPNPRGKRKTPKVWGYFAPPGTGPAGHTCGDCAHHTHNPNRTARVYHKCYLARGRWTGGPKTDIRLRSPACRAWEVKDETARS
jgi:hypothetical protein